MTLAVLGKAGDRQSKIIAVSLKTSAARRYILHSGSSDVPSLCAKRMVAILPMDSCSTERRRAAVGDADASPTPTPIARISKHVTDPMKQDCLVSHRERSITHVLPIDSFFGRACEPPCIALRD